MRNFSALGRAAAALLFFACFLGAGASVGRAEEPGQEDLDSAIEQKITAQSFEELSQVVKLCEQALDKGLSEKDTDFAREILGATLQRRAKLVLNAAEQRGPGDPRFVQLVRMALTDLTRSIESDPTLAESHYLFGQIHTIPGGDRDKAKSSFDTAYKLTEKDPPMRAKVLLARGELIEDPAERLADYAEAVKLDPGNADAHRGHALALHALDKTDDALAAVDQSLKIDEDNGRSHQLRGMILLAKDQREEALGEFDKAIELDPRDVSAYIRRGQLKLAMDQPGEAIHDFDKAILIVPKNPALFLMRAGAHQRAGDDKRALADVDSVLKLDPKNPMGLRAKALLLAGSGKIDDAIPELQKAIDAAAADSPDLPRTPRVEMLIQLGMLFSQQKKHLLALEQIDQAAKIDPENPLVFQTRADIALRIGRHEEAIKDYEKTLELESDNSGVLNNLAWLFATSTNDKVRNGKRAVELATKACELTEFKAAHILSTLAAGYAESGDFDTAIQWSTKALETAEADAKKATRPLAPGREDVREQLKQELESYQSKKPWREFVNELEEKSGEGEEGAKKSKTGQE